MTSSMKFNIEIKGNLDSLMLWSLIEKYHVNLTQVGDYTWVYGETSISAIAKVISCCALFGDLKIELSGGGE